MNPLYLHPQLIRDTIVQQYTVNKVKFFAKKNKVLYVVSSNLLLGGCIRLCNNILNVSYSVVEGNLLQLGLCSLRIRPISKGSRCADTEFNDMYGLLLDLIVPGSC